MSLLGIALWLVGIALIAVGYRRARGPWTRYRALRAQDANVARYEAWRGGVRSNDTTGASVAMEFLRRQVRDAGILIAVGVALVFVGFLMQR